MPTLQTLRLTNADGSPAALEFDEKTQTYTGTVIGQSADLTLVPSTAGCRLFVDGADVTAAGGCKVTASTGGNRTAITLKAGEETAEYTLVLYQAAASAVRIPVASADIQVTVRDRNGQKVRGQFNKTTKEYSFQLIPGQTYTYTAEDPGKPGCYSEYRFTAAAGGDTLKTATVKSGDWLTSLELAIDSKTNIALDRAFEPGQHTYEGTVADTLQAVYLKLDGDVESAVTTFSARYGMMTGTAKDGQETEVPIPAEKLGKNVLLNGLLLSRTGRGTVLTVRCSREESGVTYYQDYEITLRRSLSLEALNVSSGGQQQVLTYSGGSGYTSSVRDYTVTVPAAATDLTVTAQVYSGSGCYRDGRKNGYHVWLGDQELTPGEALAAELNGTAEAETVTLTVTNEFAEGVSSEYRILVQKAEPVYFTPELEPGSALLFVREELSGRRVWPDENGAYEISDGFLYRYLLTCAGYVGQSSTIGTIHAEDGTLLLRVDGDVALVEDGTASAKMTLTPAKENEALKMRPAQWADFRGTSYAADGTMGGSMGSNNTVLSVKTPVSVEKSTLYWANQLGSGFDSGATGCPLLVDDVLITYAGDTIYRVDPVSGEILASAKMERASSFAITPPAYAKGMVFIGLAGGTIQAFDARTLESLWVYHDPLTGQPNCPITICGDYLYTGFWRGETFDANFVCLSITDEDPTKDNEEKNACWYWTHKGGYYWAGAYACEDYVLVGADDGEDGYKKGNGELLLFDAKTGRLLDSWSEMPGDIRSSICYDEDTKAFYFTTKGGWFCSVQVEQGTDGWQLKKSSEWMMQLKNGSAEEPAMSTSTPTVYNGRAYVGVCGSSQFGAFSGHKITVIDLKEQKIAYHAETMGYPQTSGILTTAYEEDTGAVYVYFLDNITPGKLRVLKDSPGQSAPEYLTDEYGRETPYILFTPNKEEAQYAICTPVVDEYGVLYFKNDTAKMMAFGPSVELEITEQPAKTEYRVGETFDPTGMKVELVYANGQRRDVTKYVEWSQEALTEKDVEFAVRFPYVRYHDVDGEDGHTGGVKTETPVAAVTLTIREDTPEQIGGLTWRYAAQSGTLTVGGEFSGQTLIAACYDAGGRMTLVKTMTAQGDLPLDKDSARIRLFLLDKDSRPVCAAVTVKE